MWVGGGLLLWGRREAVQDVHRDHQRDECKCESEV